MMMGCDYSPIPIRSLGFVALIERANHCAEQCNGAADILSRSFSITNSSNQP